MDDIFFHSIFGDIGEYIPAVQKSKDKKEKRDRDDRDRRDRDYERDREHRYNLLQISKISNEVERIDNFRALARKLSFLSTELDILIYDSTMYVFYLSFNV